MISKRSLRVVGLTFLALSSCHSSSTSKRLVLTLVGNTERGTEATDVAFSADEKLLASCYKEDPSYTGDPRKKPSGRPKQFDRRREIKVWDVNSGKDLKSINKGNITRSIAFVPKSKNLAGAVGNAIRIWDTTTGKEKLVLNGHSDVIYDLDISRDGKLLGTGSSDGTVKVWSTQTGACLHTLKGHPDGVFYVSFSPDAKHIAGTGADRDHNGELRIWDWEFEKQVLSISRDFLIGKALFSPDGKHLAFHRTGTYKAYKPGLIEVLDTSSGELVFRREYPSERVRCIAYSPDGSLLASGLENSTITVINGRTGGEILKLAPPGYSGENHVPVRSIGFSPSGDRLAAAYWDSNVRIWDIKDLNGRKSK